jgi:hypothetical protein
MSASIIAPAAREIDEIGKESLPPVADRSGLPREAVAVGIAMICSPSGLAEHFDRSKAVGPGLAAGLFANERDRRRLPAPPRSALRNLFIERTSHAMSRRPWRASLKIV